MTGATAPGVLFVLRGIAVLGDEPKQCVTPEGSWWSDVPASAVCRKGELAFVSGQIALAPDGTVLERGSHGGQAREGLRQVAALAELAGGSLDDLVDMVSFHQDPRGMGEVAEAWEEAFAGVEPSAAAPLTTIGVPGSPRARADRAVPGDTRPEPRRAASGACRRASGGRRCRSRG